MYQWPPNDRSRFCSTPHGYHYSYIDKIDQKIETLKVFFNSRCNPPFLITCLSDVFLRKTQSIIMISTWNFLCGDTKFITRGRIRVFFLTFGKKSFIDVKGKNMFIKVLNFWNIFFLKFEMPILKRKQCSPIIQVFVNFAWKVNPPEALNNGCHGNMLQKRANMP